MAAKSEFSILGLAHKLCLAAEVQGYNPELLNALAENPSLLAGMYNVQRGIAEIKPIDHVIDLDSPAELPFDGTTLEVHRGTGIIKLERRGDDLYLDGKKINLFLSNSQINCTIGGHDLRKEIEKRGDNVCAKVLDHLVAHPELWPESWKKDKDGNTVYIFFWDDIFRGSDGGLFVRYGYWARGRVVSGYRWLDRDWGSGNPAASFVS